MFCHALESSAADFAIAPVANINTRTCPLHRVLASLAVIHHNLDLPRSSMHSLLHHSRICTLADNCTVCLSYSQAAVLKNQAVLPRAVARSEEPTSELKSLMRISYAVFCL